MPTPANSLNLTQQGVPYFDGVSIFTGLDGGTSGNVLTSNGTGIAPSFQASSGGAVTVTASAAGATASFTHTGSNYDMNLSNGTNLYLGWLSGNAVTPGTLNAFVGVNTAPSISGGNSNTGMGAAALAALLNGSTNCAFGHIALVTLTTGNGNVAVGDSALRDTLSGSANVAVGYLAGLGIQGDNNIAIGNSVMSASSVTNQYNIGIGYSALISLGSGGNNVAVGVQALANQTNLSNNVAIGFQAGVNLVNGSSNTIIGQGAGSAYTGTETNNIVIGSTVPGIAGENNTIHIGDTGGTTSATYIAGINGTTVTGTAVICSTSGQLGTVVSSARYKDNIQDMPSDTSVLDLRPVQFNYKSDEEKTIQYGLIAEEVNETFPYLCFYDAQGRPESVKYHELPVFLLKEIQKLNERIKILEK